MTWLQPGVSARQRSMRAWGAVVTLLLSRDAQLVGVVPFVRLIRLVGGVDDQGDIGVGAGLRQSGHVGAGGIKPNDIRRRGCSREAMRVRFVKNETAIG